MFQSDKQGQLTRHRKRERKKGVKAGLKRRERNGRMKAISCLRLEVSDSVKMSEKAFKTHLHFTLALLQYAIFFSAVFPPLPMLYAVSGMEESHFATSRRNLSVCLSKKLY